MKARLFAAVALAATSFAGPGPCSAGTTADAPASIALFYDALTVAPGRNVAELVKQATVPEWQSCGANDVCRTRDEVIAGIAARQKLVPDLRWEIREVLVSGDRVIVRGEATGHPAGEFMGVPNGGKSFRIMSIDVHTVEGGKLSRSYHVEDWIGAVRQLSGK